MNTSYPEGAYVPDPELRAGRVLSVCPRCHTAVAPEAIYCAYCGQLLKLANRPRRRKPWYFRPWFLVLTFLFATPVWALLVINDPEQSMATKAVGACVLLFWVIVCALSSSGHYLVYRPYY